MLPQNIEDIYPLSPLQEGLLFHTVSEPESRMYFNQTLITLSGALDVAKFREAWERVVDHHAVLRSAFVWEGVKEPVQAVMRQVNLPFIVDDLRSFPEPERPAQVEAVRMNDLRQGFNLAVAPLLRVYLLQVGEARYEFLWSFHHILLDGWSMFAVLRHVFGAYHALVQGNAPKLRRVPAYRQYIAWLRKQSLDRARQFWQQNLQDFTAPTPLPFDPDTAQTDRDGDVFATEPLYLQPETVTALETFCQKHRITQNTLVQAAWAFLLSRYSGEKDVVYGSIVSGRPASLPQVESMVGLFINTLPVRIRVQDREPVVDWLRRVQTQQVTLREFEYSPLRKVQQWSGVPAGSSLFDSLFMFENFHKEAPLEQMGGTLEISNVRWFERVNYPLVALAIPGDRFLLRLVYQRSHFQRETIVRLINHWQNVLAGFVSRPEACLADVPLATDAEKQQVVVDWNGTERAYPREMCIQQLFERQARETPDAVAVSFEGRSLTYAALNRRANQLAHQLRNQGAGPEVPVAICAERSPEMVIGLLAILKAGAAYVPLDPDYPDERLAFMLEDTGSPILLAHEKLLPRLPESEAQVILLDDTAQWDGESEANPVCLTSAGNLAYIMYTSGTTGRPKGTMIPHQAVGRLVKNTNFADLTENDVFLQFAPISFDASTLELWAPLLNGGRLVVFPNHMPSLEELGEVLHREQVTTLWLTAGLFHNMVEQHFDGLRGLRQLLAGGDVLSVEHVKRVLQEIPKCRLINGYGPTENTTFTCCYTFSDEAAIGPAAPIGRPIANTRVYLVDARMQPVPVGVAGELYAGGDGLARGYLNRPDLTAERFVPNPFAQAGQEGSRLYAVGDRAKYRADGNIDFLGRTDFQVKIRGFRIEPGEIEVALMQLPGVRNAVVQAREDTPGDRRLVAYVLPETGRTLNAANLRAALQKQLPEYMLPAAFVMLDAFPLNANGKVDRAKLPAPSGERQVENEFVAPKSQLEQTIAGIWQEVLQVERVGLHDNFFDLGGHSLALIRVHTALKAALRRDIPMVDLFKYTRISTLAAYLAGGGQAANGAQEAAQARGQRRRAAIQRRRAAQSGTPDRSQ